MPNERLDTMLAKMQEALDILFIDEEAKLEARAVLRLALAELPLIRDQYEREIKAAYEKGKEDENRRILELT